MNQTAKLRELDALAFRTFAEHGFGDAAQYDGRPVTALVNRAAQVLGAEPAQIVGTRTIVVLQLAEVPKPAAGKRLRLSGTGEEFELREELERDESRATWVVVHRG
jgi:hypothetical protein